MSATTNYQLLLSVYDTLDCTCNACTGRVYATVLNRNNQAIDFSVVPHSFATYDKAQGRFRKFLQAHAERTRYYYENIHCTAIDIDANPYGEDYTVEYWCERISGFPDRTLDTLMEVKNFVWLNDRVAESRLELTQEQNIAELAGLQVYQLVKNSETDGTPGTWGYFFANQLNQNTFGAVITGLAPNTAGGCIATIKSKVENLPDNPASAEFICHAAVGYDSENQLFHLMAWLEKDGSLQTDATALLFTMKDSDDQTILSISGTVADKLGSTGAFAKQVANVELVPDEVYFATVIITDADDVDHSSGVGPVAWD